MILFAEVNSIQCNKGNVLWSLYHQTQNYKYVNYTTTTLHSDFNNPSIVQRTWLSKGPVSLELQSEIFFVVKLLIKAEQNVIIFHQYFKWHATWRQTISFEKLE